MANCMFSTAVTGNLVPDSAADGDLDMAYGYLLAHHQWGSSGAIDYFDEARKIIAALKKHEINPETKLIMLGDWADVKADYYMARYGNGFLGPYKTTMRSHREFYYGTRLSDFMLGHFRAFGPASGDGEWNGAILDKHYELIARIQSMYSMPSGLLPDFIESTNTGAKPGDRTTWNTSTTTSTPTTPAASPGGWPATTSPPATPGRRPRWTRSTTSSAPTPVAPPRESRPATV